MNTTAPSLDASATVSAAAVPLPTHLPSDVATLQEMIRELLVTLQAKDRELDGLRHRLHLLLQRLYGPRSERFDPNQLLLFTESATQPNATATPLVPMTEPATAPKRRARPHGRRRLPADLPREARHHELAAAARLCPGCGATRRDIGVDRSEQLDYRPASLLVIEHFVHKYACPCCSRSVLATVPAAFADAPSPAPACSVESAVLAEQVQRLHTLEHGTPTVCLLSPSMSDREPSADVASAQPTPPPPATVVGSQPASLPDIVVSAAKPQMPIHKGLPGAGLLAHLIVSKFVDHLPLYRLERIYQRQGVFLPRSTTCDWLASCAELLRPLYQRLVAVVLQSRVLHTDDTPIKIHTPLPAATTTGRLWTYLGDMAHPYNAFDFTPNRKRDGPQRFLENFQGYLQADAFTGYDALYLPDPRDGVVRIVEVACNAHARRKFYEARTSDALRSHVALGYYRQLYELERAAKAAQLDEAGVRQMRQDIVVPILAAFQNWLEQQRAEVLPKSPLGEAIGYALNNWTALARYTERGFLAIDNNVAEREMKRIAIGRKNWLFVGSEKGGHTAAVLLSFTSTCQRLGVEPWAYLQDVLSRLPTTPSTQLADLLPDHWQAAQAAAAKPPC
jgi:transposase